MSPVRAAESVVESESEFTVPFKRTRGRERADQQGRAGRTLARVHNGAMIRRNVIVEGNVQGVGFRWSARQTAHTIGVAGFARNSADGTVEVEIEGEPEKVERMLDWLRTGPPGADVSGVTVTDREPLGEDAFRVRESQ
jgi:acylphosphatase